MRQVGGDYKHLAGTNGDFILAACAEPKSQRAVEDIGDLFVLVRMLRHVVALLEIDVGNHHAPARYQPTLEAALQLFGRQLRPPIMLGAARTRGFHRRLPDWPCWNSRAAASACP